jgi:nucleotide-binding universal stress UspA family protein
MYKSLLVALDGSEYSERALAMALEFARLSGGKVTLATVVLAYRDAHIPEIPALDGQARKRAEAYLEPFLAKAKDAGFDVDGVIAHGDPAEELVRIAGDRKADLIVMSTHGMGASGRHAIGSVALRVLENACCPVLMVHIGDAA